MKVPKTVTFPGGRKMRVYPLVIKTPKTPYRLNPRQKVCAARFIGEEMKDLKKGRWVSREQAIAVGLSRANREC